MATTMKLQRGRGRPTKGAEKLVRVTAYMDPAEAAALLRAADDDSRDLSKYLRIVAVNHLRSIGLLRRAS